jgi:hypothetical protein
LAQIVIIGLKAPGLDAVGNLRPLFSHKILLKIERFFKKGDYYCGAEFFTCQGKSDKKPAIEQVPAKYSAFCFF